MKFGLEKEFFLLQDGKPQPVLMDDRYINIPHDECGFLVEARGEPHALIIDAVFSLKASVYKIERQLADLNKNVVLPYSLSDSPVLKVDRATRLKCSRHFVKGLTKYQNLYSYESHRNSLAEATAGIHVSFTCEESFHVKDGEYKKYNANFDWAQIFIKLDKAFAEEIKTSKRRPGFYELKPDGRIEYRSLPANADLDKLIEVLTKVI